jgi:hypothetical protein
MRHNDGYRAGALLGSKSWYRTLDHDHIHIEADKFRCDVREPVSLSFSIAVVDNDVFAL